MEEVLIFALGAFPAAGEDQHCGVQAGGIRTSRALGNDDLDEKDFASRGHCCSAVGQDFDRRLVVPVVDDPLQQVGVLAGWHTFGEVAGELLDTTGGDVAVDGPVGCLHDVGESKSTPDRPG